ncbi:hypothetical protein C8Q79DRAFT_232885 [Trametes meyenii]|nr:hypothetical protein C8Q79DRAFT_232885 [Trametes meyenii]
MVRMRWIHLLLLSGLQEHSNGTTRILARPFWDFFFGRPQTPGSPGALRSSKVREGMHQRATYYWICSAERIFRLGPIGSALISDCDVLYRIIILRHKLG